MMITGQQKLDTCNKNLIMNDMECACCPGLVNSAFDYSQCSNLVISPTYFYRSISVRNIRL